MKEYKTAVIGCGRIASQFDKKIPKDKAFSHAGAYYLHKKTQMVCASDLDLNKLNLFKKKWDLSYGYQKYRQMLRNHKIDILSICTPPETHLEIIKYAVKFPLKAIYCEKPIALNYKDSEKIVNLCKKNNILLMINHQRRFQPFYKRLRGKINQGFFGDIQQVNCYYTRGIFNTGVHIIDLFRFLFGEVKSVFGSKSCIKSPFRDDPNMNVVMNFGNGATAVLRACDDSSYLILEIDILGRKRRLKISNKVESFKPKTVNNQLGLKVLVRENNSFFADYFPVSLTHAVSHIINCIEKKEKPLSSGDDGARAVKIIEASLKSSISRKLEKV